MGGRIQKVVGNFTCGNKDKCFLYPKLGRVYSCVTNRQLQAHKSMCNFEFRRNCSVHGEVFETYSRWYHHKGKYHKDEVNVNGVWMKKDD